jgi:hypothetical protein
MELNYYDNLVEATQDLSKRGYQDQFKYDNNKLVNVSSKRAYEAHQLTIVEYHRFEGMSNPADSSVIFVLETEDDQKGTLVMSYAADANMDLVSFIDKVKIKTTESADMVA